MTEKTDIPEWAMKAATDALNIDVWYEDGRSLLQESVALAILQARSQAFEESAKIAENYRHGNSGFSANEPDKTVYGWGVARREISKAIRQHSQKGRDAE